jgi:hypothetical protein
MLEKPLFPTMFYEAKISDDLAFAVLEEIKSKQFQIDTVSEATQIIPVSDYSTDFVHSIRIDSFWDHVVPQLQEEWTKLNMTMANIHSWVSCYTGPSGHHPLHNHKMGYDGRLHYSAILYLSRVGTTDFFSLDCSARNHQYSHQSSFGSVIFFPSIIPHQYRSDHYDGNARYTLPFNCEIVNLT